MVRKRAPKVEFFHLECAILGTIHTNMMSQTLVIFTGDTYTPVTSVHFLWMIFMSVACSQSPTTGIVTCRRPWWKIGNEASMA